MSSLRKLRLLVQVSIGVCVLSLLLSAWAVLRLESAIASLSPVNSKLIDTFFKDFSHHYNSGESKKIVELLSPVSPLRQNSEKLSKIIDGARAHITPKIESGTYSHYGFAGENRTRIFCVFYSLNLPQEANSGGSFLLKMDFVEINGSVKLFDFQIFSRSALPFMREIDNCKAAFS